MGFREMRRNGDFRKPKANRHPLRKIVDHVYGDEDGEFMSLLFEVLECGHRQTTKQDFVGETNAERRRCRKCGMKPV